MKRPKKIHKIEMEVVLILTLVLKGNLAGSFLEGGAGFYHEGDLMLSLFF